MSFYKKVLQGTFNQGHPMFGETAGRQCSCCSLFAIFFTIVKSPGHWDRNDLDFVVQEGDTLYKSKNTTDFLMVTQLPCLISKFRTNVNVKLLENNVGVVSFGNTSKFFSKPGQYEGNGLILFLKGLCIAVFWTKRNIFLFDSHSRDENGMATPYGTAILVKFDKKRDLERHLSTVYLNEHVIEVQYETQNIAFEKEDQNIDFSTEYHKEKRNLRNAKKSKVKGQKELSPTTSRKRNSEKGNYEQESFHVGKRSRKEHKIRDNKSIVAFREAIKNGPFFICVVCNRCMYRKTVKPFHTDSYPVSIQHVTTSTESFDSRFYICHTCDCHLLKNDIPCQAVWSKLELVPIPLEIASLNRLEKILISKRILFKKISIMPKGQQSKVKGAICNIPVRADKVSACLPHGMESNGLIFVKLKRKLSFRGHVVFESVRPDMTKSALEYLKGANPFYSDVLIKIDNISKELLTISDAEALVEQDSFPLIIEERNLEQEDPLDSERANSDEMCIIPNIYNQEEGILDIAPGEGKKPQHFFTDHFYEEQAFPFLFPTGKFGYKVVRPIHLSPTKYFNQRLLNYTQRFSSNADYMFFAHYVTQQIHLHDQINVATRKVRGDITAGQLQRNFQETVQSFVSKDQGYLLMKSIKGTPAYWKNFLHDVLAMVKQLGLPTFFLTLSCADLRWDELIQIIARISNIEINENDLDYYRRCNLLNQNPVLTARHFQYRVEVFFKEVQLHKNCCLGKIDNYVIKVEFQFRGSPHVHCFLWLSSAPVLNNDTKDEYSKFVDSIVHTDLPDSDEEPELHRLVSQYQIHAHSNSCRKYKNVSCRFHYGRYFTEKTVIAQPLFEEMLESERSAVLSFRAKLLKKVKTFIDENLDPHKATYKKPDTIVEILHSLGITEQDYYKALSISADQDYEIHYRRPPDSCFVNNYFEIGLLSWQANIDIQLFFNYFKAVSYMCSYFSKTESVSSLAMKKAPEDAEKENLGFKDQMKKLAIAFLSQRQCSLQEAVYQVMPELWLRKTFPAVVFANTNLPERRYRLFKSQEQLQEVPEDSTDVFKRNNLDRYTNRPNTTSKNGKYAILDDFCYAEFLAFYVLHMKPNLELEDDNQLEILSDDVPAQAFECHFPESIHLMNSSEKMRRRNVKRVVRYHTPNPVSNPEGYAHHLLMLFYPFHNEHDLKSQEDNLYSSKLRKPDILKKVNRNKAKFEPFGDVVDTVLMSHSFVSATDPYAQQENDDVQEELIEDENQGDDGLEGPIPISEQSVNERSASAASLNLISDQELKKLIQSLNDHQRTIFDTVYTRAKCFVKNLSSDNPKELSPLYLFITGGAGTGKSHLIKTIHAALSKTLSYRSNCIDKPYVLLLAPTGVAAININGNTIHSALGIPVETRGLTVPKLPDKRRCNLRMELSEVKAIIIDEISMVSNILLLYVHQRLLEVFGSDYDKPFAGLTVILVGDLYQLPPVLQRPVFAEFYSELHNIYPLWRNFRMCELTEVMRQRGDATLIDLLNRIRIDVINEDDKQLLMSKFMNTSDDYPRDALHIFAENEPARHHNTLMLDRTNGQVTPLVALDQIPKGVPNYVYEKVLTSSQSKTGGLAYHLEIKIGARVMLTSNIDIPDRLINGQIGTIVSLRIVIRFDLLKQKTFNHGQLYVALSRVQSLNGLYLTGQFNSGAITADSKVTAEYNFLRENQSIAFPDHCDTENDDLLAITVCNVRSLRAHAADIRADKTFLSSDIILRSESQLTEGSTVNGLFINGFHLSCNNREDRFLSLAMYHRHSLEVIHNLGLNGFSTLTVTSQDSLPTLKVLLL